MPFNAEIDPLAKPMTKHAPSSRLANRNSVTTSLLLVYSTMLQPNSANVLRVGTAIEVLRKLNHQHKARLFWCPARIQKLCFRGAAGDEEGTATIQYERKFGFDQSTSAVILIQGQVLSKRDSRSGELNVHKWRLEEETPGSSSSGQKGMNADAGKHLSS
jgi:hypothetical protein